MKRNELRAHGLAANIVELIGRQDFGREIAERSENEIRISDIHLVFGIEGIVVVGVGIVERRL